MFMIISLPLTIADRIAVTLDGLCKAVAARSYRGALATATILVIWTRVRRIEGRIQRLLALFLAGRLRVRPRAQVGARPGTRVGGGWPGGVSTGLPRRFGWLMALVPYKAACFAGPLRTELAEPEMVALLGASPQARRVLRPLCRMLGIEPEMLTPAVTGVAPGSSADAAACPGVDATGHSTMARRGFIGYTPHLSDPTGDGANPERIPPYGVVPFASG
jgi:hypothetical protein